ncbi:MAG: hypothetical protein ACM3Q2_08355 [Syntrophothermus sp.]
MIQSLKKENVDMLIDSFWESGYLTLSRRFGTYLPEPRPVGTYQVDVVGRSQRKYAIGIILTEEDFLDCNLTVKVSFLASRHTRYSNTKVTLFIGVDAENWNKAGILLSTLPAELKKNIRLVQLNCLPVSRSDAA